MVGKINAVKMVSLPRFFHLFQSIPSCIPQSYFKQLDRIIFQFLWNYKTARIKKQHFFKSKDKGGFGLPFFKAYYWAAHLHIFSWWNDDPLEGTCEQLEWLRIEQALCSNSSLQALCISPGKVSKLIYNNHFIIGQSLKVWKQIKIYIKAPNVYLYSPICMNHS